MINQKAIFCSCQITCSFQQLVSTSHDIYICYHSFNTISQNTLTCSEDKPVNERFNPQSWATSRHFCGNNMLVKLRRKRDPNADQKCGEKLGFICTKKVNQKFKKSTHKRSKKFERVTHKRSKNSEQSEQTKKHKNNNLSQAGR